MTRRLTAELALALALLLTLAACSSGTDGQRIANQARRSVATTLWQLYSSLGNGYTKSGADGAFTQCGASSGNSVAYTVHLLVGPRVGGTPPGQFLTALASHLNAVRWHLSQSGGTYRATRNSGAQVELGPPPPSLSETAASAVVKSTCTDVGAAATDIVTAYQNHSDHYVASQASASPVPTGFPSP
jgi:hypothetical protein